MTGARRFSLSSPDWGQAHLSLDAIVAYVDDELSPGAHARAQAHLDGCGECRAEVGRPASGPRGPARAPVARACRRRCCAACGRSRSRPSCPRCRPGLGVTADGQFVLLRDVPQADPGAGPDLTSTTCTRPACPGLPPAGLGPGPVAAPRRFSRRARIGAVSGLALGALAVGALAAPGGTPEPVAPSGVLGARPHGGAAPSSAHRRRMFPASLPRWHDPSAARAWRTRRSRCRTARPADRIPAAFHPDPLTRVHRRRALSC